MRNKVLVISPHPDDESLGAAGYLLKLKASGCNIYWLNVTHMAEEYGYTKEQILRRNEQINAVQEIFGFKAFYNLELEPAGLEKIDLGYIIEQFKKVLEEVQPQLVILPYKFDAHSDHGIVFDAAYACLKSFRAPYVKKVICMEIISETDQSLEKYTFSPNMFVNIDDFLEEKLRIIKIYDTEIQKTPFPRNLEVVKALAAYRGATAYCKYAEAYRIIKEYE